MEIYTDNWFKYIRDDILTEGLRDMGLPEFVVDYLEDSMPNASEKAKVYIANQWKGSMGQMAGAFTIETLKYEMVSYLIDNALKDYVFYNATDEPGTSKHTRDPEARFIPPYDPNIPSSERPAYDDEKLKQNEQVKFVIINLRNTVGRPMGTWRKAFMKAVKALSKAGLPSEKVEEIKEYLRSLYNKNFHFWLNGYSELVAFLNDDPTNYELIKGEEDIYEAQKIAINYLNNKEEPENIIHTFEDGSYWYNLQVSSCDVEAARMGHCGSDSRGVLISLRKKKGKRRESSSYITMTYSEHDRTIYQIKGRSNDAPPEEAWDHIVWFIDTFNVLNVEETGEHSNDQEGIEEMINYLASQTTASFHGSIEERMEKAEEYCRSVDERFWDQRDEMEQADISYSIEESDMGQEVYVYMSADYTFEINLGWTDLGQTDQGFTPKDPQDFKEIPRTYSGQRDFAQEIGLDEMMYQMPGSDGDYEYEIVMLRGAQPNYEDLDDDIAPTAHLRARLTTTETAAADADGEVPEYDEFADNMLYFDENDAPAALEEIRQALSAGGYMAKTPYDKNREGLESLTDLDKWHVKKEKGGLEFDWTAEDGQPLHYYPKSIPPEAQMYGMGTGNQMGQATGDGIFREIFGYGKSYHFANLRGMVDPSISRVFAAKLSNLVNNSLKQTIPGQEEFNFGEKYKARDPVKFLADDTDFVLFNKLRWDPDHQNAYPTQTLAWLYRMRVGPGSDPDEFEIIRDIAEYLNEKPELVTQAANETIAFYLDAFMENINRRKERVLSNEEAQSLINRTKEIYGAALEQSSEDSNLYEVAQRIYELAAWFEEHYNDMDEIERYVMITRYLGPMAGSRFRSYSNIGALDSEGAPAIFPELVDKQRKAMRREDPTSQQESIEHQIHRIEYLLAEAKQDTRPKTEPTPFKSKAQKRYKRSRKKNSKMYNTAGHKNLKTGSPYIKKGKRAGTDKLRFEEVDVRLYKMQIDAVVAPERARGGSKLLQDELRSIEGVTVISVEESADLSSGADLTRFNVKFSLQGQTPRVDFVQKKLLPALRRVAGFNVKDWSIPEEVTPGKKIREDQPLQEYGFGGLVGNLSALRRPEGTKMVTPRMSLQAIVDDWAEGGVMAYDVAADTTDMRYTVMMPVEELIPYMSREYRGDMNDFHGRYQHFIKDGATAPVYVAIGMNGRVKITGNEDIVWFAKKAGLEELPVFLSYQKQA